MVRGAARAAGLLAFAMGALVMFLGAAAAQNNSTRSLTQVERDRAAAALQAEALRNQAAAARREVAQLDQRLVESGHRRADAEAAAADAERRLAALRLRAQVDGARYQHDRDAFEAALITAALADRRGDRAASRIGLFARAAAPTLNGRVRHSAEAIDEVRRLDEAIAEEQRILADAGEAIDAERADVVTLLAQRRAVQTTLVNDAAAADRRARQFAAEARTLRELAQRVSSNRTNRRSSGGDALPASWVAPAEGRITRAFGERIAGGPAAQGVAVRTRSGAQVIAPASGEVAYAGLFRSYGNVLILNVDGGYALVLTGLGTVRARVGETVLAGQPVGEMPVSDTPAPELYVEVRREGRPIDPARWLSSRGLTADRSSGGAG